MSLKNLWRNNFIRKKYIADKQSNYLESVSAGINNRLILFLVPGFDRVNGGILSIISLAEETEKLKSRHKADVFVCTMPGDPPLSRFTKFKNSMHVVDLQMLLSRSNGSGSVLVHIPEIFVERYSQKIKQLVTDHPGIQWQFNILLQNIDLIPKRSSVECLKEYGTTTCTTAHQAYSNKETEDLIGCSIYHFSVWVSPEKYINNSYEEKRNLIVVSPDKHPRRKEILEFLKGRMSDYEFRVIKNMTYEEYKRVIASAKFSLTFGEGLDGYLIEPVFSGSVGSAVYNNKFFTDDLSELPFIYPSWDELKARFPEDVESIDNAERYSFTNSLQFKAFAMHYSHEKYIQNLMDYYDICFKGSA
ncbi:MAG: hypothetical protein A2079_00690 [Geobacteraceae bacterium GWC2_48_7]|nr:MAG: hypothetical protein A2079_00690 [Geobacteraceae bacterium GWC2_48_7]